jgi:hypothetical protein
MEVVVGSINPLPLDLEVQTKEALKEEALEAPASRNVH